MSLLTILAIAVGLAMDAFAVAIAAGLTIAPLTGRHVFRLSFHFGLFQFLMPVTGWLTHCRAPQKRGGKGRKPFPPLPGREKVGARVEGLASGKVIFFACARKNGV